MLLVINYYLLTTVYNNYQLIIACKSHYFESQGEADGTAG